MKKGLFLIAFIFSLGATTAQDSAFVRGNEAYANSDFETALKEYNKIVGAEQMSSELYYNLGNTYYKLDQLGEAIWAYERALKIDPGNENAAFNLKFVNQNTYDGLEYEESAILKWLKINLLSFGINFWAYFSLFMTLLLAVAIYLFFVTKNQKIKNLSITAGFGSLFLLIMAIILAYFNKTNITNRTHAVIITEFLEVKSSPSETAEEAFKLHEGTKVELLRSNENWMEIDVNGNTGWVPKTGIWEI